MQPWNARGEMPDKSSTRRGGGRQFKEIKSASTWGEAWDVARFVSTHHELVIG
jgi:hypothetical protein